MDNLENYSIRIDIPEVDEYLARKPRSQRAAYC